MWLTRQQTLCEATMMEKEVDGYYNNYKSRIIFLLAASGVWPSYRRCSNAVKKFLTLLAVFAEFAVTVGVGNFCLHNLTNMNVLTKGLGLIISTSSAMLKVLIMVIYRDDVKKLNRNLSYQFEKDLEIIENRPFLLAHYSSFHRYLKLHSFCTGTVILLKMISPLLALRHGTYIRAYPQLIPFAYEPGGWVHWAIYAFELIEGWYCWTNTVGIDSLFGLYAFHLVGQLKLLAYRFRNLKTGFNYKKQLKDCVDRHASLIGSKHLMEKIFGFLSVWLAVTCAIVICANLFQSSQTFYIQSIFKVIYLMVYCTIKFLQAYTYAWFGHIINIESEACIHSIYHSYWAGRGDSRLMNDILIILSQNPMHFKALSVMIVRMDMVSTILNTSVSYFFLLKTLDAKLRAS